MTNQEVYDDVVKFIEGEIPGFNIGYKNESVVSKILGVLSYLFNPKYMTDFTTTRYPDVYFPSREFVDENWEFARAWKILAHEYVHLWDRKKSWLFNIGYIMPQLFIVFAFLALFAIPFSNWHLLNLLWLVFAAPLPAPWRMKAELRGYTMSMAVNYWRYGEVQQRTKNWIAAQFTGPSYYFMWPFKENIVGALNTAEQKLINGSIFHGPEGEVFRKVYALLNEKGYTKV